MRTPLFCTFLLLINLIAAQPATFIAADQPPAPDYSLEKNWAALPFRQDSADDIPSFEHWISDSLKNADVFFIYPTIYLTGKTWNEDVNDKALNKRVDSKTIKYQASVFNASCRVYAPRYRQAALKSFYGKSGQARATGDEALDFAYQDVKRAFEYYLQHYNNGRPIILASHSQGSLHARKLLHDFFDNNPELRHRLVCAYVVGFGITDTMFQNLKPCGNSGETGCYVTWASFKYGYEPVNSPLYGNICVNPVTWNSDTVYVDASKSIGSLLLSFNKEYPHACATQIHHHHLWVQTSLPFLRRMRNLHIADYNLFWFDIRKNVADRVQSFMKK